MLIFGGRWDAPVADDAELFPETPTYAACLYCGEQFVDGDQGVIMPYGGGSVDPQFLVGVGDGYALIGEHRECQLAQIVGHLVKVCSCTGWERSRATAREVDRRVAAGGLLR